MKRIQIEETIERSISDFIGNIQEVIEWLEAMKKDGWETIDFDWDKDIVFTRYRLETDKEFEKRKNQKQKEKVVKDKLRSQLVEQELAVYQKLKKKYENN